MKKYYWLKLKKDFFKRHDITVIENMENGKDYVLFYLKLLVESLSHEGNLRFSDTIPYDEKMLSSITNTNIDIVRSAIKIFTNLTMMEIQDDGTIYMNEVQTMIGNETDWAKKKRLYREKQKELPLGQNRTMSDKSIELEKELDIEKDKKQKKPIVYFENSKVNNLFNDFLNLRKQLKAKNTDRAITLLTNELNKYDDNIKIQMIEKSIMNSWKSVFPLSGKDVVKQETKIEKERYSGAEEVYGIGGK